MVTADQIERAHMLARQIAEHESREPETVWVEVDCTAPVRLQITDSNGEAMVALTELEYSYLSDGNHVRWRRRSTAAKIRALRIVIDDGLPFPHGGLKRYTVKAAKARLRAPATTTRDVRRVTGGSDK